MVRMDPMGHATLEGTAARAATLVAVDGRTYPLLSAHLEARAEGGLAASTLRQTYANPYDEPLEVIYTMPLPADGAVLGYTIRIGERRIEAEVQPREQATAAYRDALYRGQTAGILEEHRRDTFEQRLGNVPAHTTVEIAIEVLHPLAFFVTTPSRRPAELPWYQRLLRGEDLAGMPDAIKAPRSPEWEYRFPTVVGMRYHGAAGRVPDAEALSPDRADGEGIPASIGLTLTIADGNASTAHSPSHAIDSAPTDGLARVTFQRGERLDRDIVVRWDASTEVAGVRMVEGGGLAGDNGRYALVTVVPPATAHETFHRAVTVLLDASGSMSGAPLALAKRVVAELIRSCEPGDRFELLAFSSSVKSLTGGMTPASERTVRDALNALDAVRAGGGTEMSGAVDQALGGARDDVQRQIVLVTDGEIGFESDVVRRIGNARNVRFHLVGVGSSPNRGLTAAAAQAGRGLELLVGTERDAAEAGRRLAAGTARPVIVDLEVGGTALAKSHAAPLRDVYAGQPLVFALELKPAGGSIALRGALPGSHQPWIANIEMPDASGVEAKARTPLPIGAFHGRALIGQLEIELDCDREHERPQLEAAIEALGMRHKIASRRTSLVAIADDPSVDPRAPRRRERLAVEVPAGVSAAGAGLEWSPLSSRTHVVGQFGPSAMKSMPRSARPTITRAYSIPPPEAAAAPKSRSAADAASIFGRREALSVTAEGHWLTPALLLLEFEFPKDAQWVQAHFVTATMSHGGRVTSNHSLEVDWSQSTPVDACATGMRVRLVLRVPVEFRCTAGDELTVAGPVILDDLRGSVLIITLRCMLPEQAHAAH